MGVGAGLSMYVVVVQMFTFAISSPDEFLLTAVISNLLTMHINLLVSKMLMTPIIFTEFTEFTDASMPSQTILA